MINISPLEDATIVFDLDGTLVNTAPDLQATLNHVLETSGFAPVKPEVSQGFIGSGAKAMLRAGLEHQNIVPDAHTLDGMFDLFLSHYASHIAVQSHPYEGCVDALSRLAAAGAVLAVCTNKKQRLAEILLDTLGLTSRFAAIVGADSVDKRKPDAMHLHETLRRAGRTQARALMIGDSDTDEKAALNTGLPFLFVPFGYGPIDQSTHSQRSVLNHYDDLSVALVEGLLGFQAAATLSDSSDPAE